MCRAWLKTPSTIRCLPPRCRSLPGYLSSLAKLNEHPESHSHLRLSGSTWQDPNGEPVISCAFITTQANELLQPIHDRMPVILPRDIEALWLDNEMQDAATLVSLLAPYPSEAIETYEVSTLVTSAFNTGLSCWRLPNNRG